MGALVSTVSQLHFDAILSQVQQAGGFVTFSSGKSTLPWIALAQELVPNAGNINDVAKKLRVFYERFLLPYDCRLWCNAFTLAPPNGDSAKILDALGNLVRLMDHYW
jgi:hypothetical protein